jgi:hypothetical protein
MIWAATIKINIIYSIKIARAGATSSLSNASDKQQKK